MLIELRWNQNLVSCTRVLLRRFYPIGVTPVLTLLHLFTVGLISRRFGSGYRSKISLSRLLCCFRTTILSCLVVKIHARNNRGQIKVNVEHKHMGCHFLLVDRCATFNFLKSPLHTKFNESLFSSYYYFSE